MKNQSTFLAENCHIECSRSLLDEYAQLGAQLLVGQALVAEVEEYIEEWSKLVDKSGRRLVARNGYMPEREIATGAGMLKVKQPRVNDRREGHRFTSAILPRYARRSPTIDTLIPVLYLKGVSTGDFREALEHLLGPAVAGLSAATITRLLEQWQEEYRAWCKRDLSGKKYAYVWVDGIYTGVRLTDERPCMLVVIGVCEDGTKELLAVIDGERESALSWREVLLDLKRRGLQHAPSLAIGDGALGFWKACSEIWPATRQQLCWVHKTANVLDKLPTKLQPAAKHHLHEIYQAPTRADALSQLSTFKELYGAKYPKAVGSLERVEDQLLTFYDFPAEHWLHIRTTNVVESMFGTIRLRHRRTKGNGSRDAAVAMMYKLGIDASKTWRKVNNPGAVVKLLHGVTYVDGVAAESDTSNVTSRLAA